MCVFTSANPLFMYCIMNSWNALQSIYTATLRRLIILLYVHTCTYIYLCALAIRRSRIERVHMMLAITQMIVDGWWWWWRHDDNVMLFLLMYCRVPCLRLQFMTIRTTLAFAKWRRWWRWSCANWLCTKCVLCVLLCFGFGWNITRLKTWAQHRPFFMIVIYLIDAMRRLKPVSWVFSVEVLLETQRQTTVPIIV